MSNRTQLVYALLLAAWGLVVSWQVVEHHRVKVAGQSAVISGARKLTRTLGVIIRSQRRFGGVVFQQRIESALKELVESGELKSVALLNTAGAVVASAGEPRGFDRKTLPPNNVRWSAGSVTIVNLVDLGPNAPTDGEPSRPTIVLPAPPPGTDPRRDRSRFPPLPGAPGGTNASEGDSRAASTGGVGPRSGRSERPPEGRPRSGRPPWMTEDEYAALLDKQGLHELAVVVSTEAFEAALTQDLWLRLVIVGFAGVGVAGSGLAWRNIVRSSQSQMRLLRASQLNAHLREMNVAAAGLAHETRNPLNIIRGLAQMISKEAPEVSEIRGKALEIADEVDRVTAQLNEFINYSKPREVRRAPVALSAVVADVVRALNTDLEDKAIQLILPTENLTVVADEQLLRQVLFNFLINAIQAVEPKGEIQICAGKSSPHEAFFEVRDNGAGVPPELRKDVFKPYFTTHQKGTGLGLAVVQQIVSAHGWDVDCLGREPRGAVFRVSRIPLAAKA